MKEIKKNLEEKALKALQYINKNEVLNKTLKNICEKYVTNRDVVPMRFYERSIKLCFYGLANTVLLIKN